MAWKVRHTATPIKKQTLLLWGIGFSVIGLITLSISHATTPITSVEPERGTLTGSAADINDTSASGGSAVRFAAPTSFGTAVLITPTRIARMKSLLASQTQPNYASWLQLLNAANAALSHTPSPPANWDITSTVYTDPTAYSAAIAPLKNDGSDVFRLALAYRMTGDTRYATKAASILDAWATTTGFSASAQRNWTATKLAWCEMFPSMIWGADLLRSAPQFTATDQTHFSDFVANSLTGNMSLAYGHSLTYDPSNPNLSTYINNQDSWGLVFETSAAVYLKDQTRYTAGVARYKAIQDASLDANNQFADEIHRQASGQGDGSSGLHYSNFSLAAMTYAAEVMHTQGTDVYDYISSGGRSLHSAWTQIANWSANNNYPYDTSCGGVTPPCSITPFHTAWDATYYEILNNRWPDTNAQAILTANRPIQSTWSLFDPTFIYAGGSGG